MIKRILRVWFDKTPIIPGDIYEFDDDDPFAPVTRVEVIAVKNNWIKFKPESRSEDSLRKDIFRFCYKLAKR